MRAAWEGEIAIREKYRSYFEGLVFKQKVPVDSGAEEEAPELFPVGINIAKMLCTAQAHSLWGEWEEEIVKFEPRQDSEVASSEKDAAVLASNILATSQANTLLWEVGLDREIYGGGAVKINLGAGPGFIKWSRVPLESFFPIWNPDDPDDLVEVYIIVDMTREQAKARYGIDSDKDVVRRIEHWTKFKFENILDGHVISQYSGFNPWGMIPFEYIPRIRSTNWWGDSQIEDVMRPMDELNMRVADLGEAINYNANPIRWGYNLPKAFNSRNFPIGAGVFWDFGRVLGQGVEPTVGMLESKNPVPQGSFDYVKFLYDWSRTASNAPPIAFGEDNGGGQRSGITLEIRMWPLIKATRTSRAYMSDGLIRLMRKSAIMLKQKNLSDVPKRAVQHLLNGDLTPRYAPIMIRDQAAIVDEVQKGLATNPPTISLETAVKKLGYGTAEVERIKAMLKDDDLYARKEKMEQAKLDAKTNEQKTKEMNSGAGAAPKKEAE
ncbi:MAG TPA: phage portal protein [Bellilinea sp.]|nr:phage portal protein [Bellilinea sp.]